MTARWRKQRKEDREGMKGGSSGEGRDETKFPKYFYEVQADAYDHLHRGFSK
jgi:hypothetical protein